MNVNAELKKSMSKVRAFFNTPEVIEKKIELFYHEEKTKSEILEMCIDFFLENNGTLSQDTFSSINEFTGSLDFGIHYTNLVKFFVVSYKSRRVHESYLASRLKFALQIFDPVMKYSLLRSVIGRKLELDDFVANEFWSFKEFKQKFIHMDSKLKEGFKQKTKAPDINLYRSLKPEICELIEKNFIKQLTIVNEDFINELTFDTRGEWFPSILGGLSFEEFSQKHKLTQTHKQILSMLFKQICFFDLDSFLMLYGIKDLRFNTPNFLKSYFKKVHHCLDEYQKTEILINTGFKNLI